MLQRETLDDSQRRSVRCARVRAIHEIARGIRGMNPSGTDLQYGDSTESSQGEEWCLIAGHDPILGAPPRTRFTFANQK